MAADALDFAMTVVVTSEGGSRGTSRGTWIPWDPPGLPRPLGAMPKPPRIWDSLKPTKPLGPLRPPKLLC